MIKSHSVVIHIDDAKFERMMFARAFEKHDLPNVLEAAEDGLQALEILRDREKYPLKSTPFIVFVDLNMPRMGGLEFLKEVRSDPKLYRTLVYAMSTSSRPSEIDECYEQGVAGFILKDDAGTDYSHIANLIKTLNQVLTLSNQSLIF